MAKSLVNPRSVYTWDARALKYRGPDGRFVSQRAVTQALRTYVRRVQAGMGSLTAKLTAKKINLPEWQRQMKEAIKSSHLANAAAAKGGWGQMTKRDFGKVGAALKVQYRHLKDFAKALKRRQLSPKQIAARAGMYARSAAGAYERGRFDSFMDKVDAGVDVQMRNVLGNGEHCEAGKGRSGCLEEADRGWVPLGEMSLPGERTCLSNCLCSVEYRTDENQD